MSDQNVREIQLGGKQLVFLFMASVILAVAIFLLGISVGRGVGAPAADAAADAGASGAAAPAEMPPPTETTPADLSYHDKLQDQTPPKAAAQSTPAPEPAKPAPTDTTSVAVAPPATPPPAQPASAQPAPAAAARASTPPTTKPGPGWYVQVAAFKSRENADRQVSQLKAKGYSAIVQSDPGSLFRVRIGPFQERGEANATAERLQREDGIRASISR